MLFDDLNVYALAGATVEKKLGHDSYLKLALTTGRASCERAAEPADQAAGRKCLPMVLLAAKAGVLAGNHGPLGTADSNINRKRRRQRCLGVAAETTGKGLGPNSSLWLSFDWQEGLGWPKGGQERTRSLSGPTHQRPKFKAQMCRSV
jgi:hypothetical protein